jgi:hemolysin III
MIYVLIAGTFTPIAVLVLRDPLRWPALAIMWAGAFGGVALKTFGFRYRKVGGAVYIVLGWAGLIAFPSLVHRPTLFLLVAAGGALYTVGAILFSLRRPVLSPKWFGYHEVWHIFVVAAGVLLFIANYRIVHAG